MEENIDENVDENSKSEQTIYINLDDSGKLVPTEKFCIYGGILFFSKEEKDKFITQYRDIVDNIKCKYCKDLKETCSNTCPELKCNILRPRHRRRILNYIKKYFVISCVIKNDRIYEYIMKNKASKGRYLDYALRRLIKDVVKQLVKSGKISPDLPLTIYINIDEQTTKSNGYYNLKEGIEEELVHGIYNFDYNKFYAPILNNSLKIKLKYRKSDKDYAVQSADLIAGTVRKNNLIYENDVTKLLNSISFVDYKIFLP